MRWTLTSIAVIAACSAAAGVPTALATPARTARTFTIKDVSLRAGGGHFTYALTICTPGNAELSLSGVFKPIHATHGARTVRPGSTQYQSSGCWPAKVSTTIASRGGACQPLSCPAIKGQRYRAVVRITDHRSGQTQSAPMRMATA